MRAPIFSSRVIEPFRLREKPYIRWYRYHMGDVASDIESKADPTPKLAGVYAKREIALQQV